MALVECNQGTRLILEMLANKTAAANLVLHLFQNNYAPTITDTEANYTEATFSGYAAVTLTGASWTSVEASPSTISYAQQSFISNANQALQNIYGYYITSNGKLIAAERFTAAEPIQNNTDTVKVTPVLTQISA